MQLFRKLPIHIIHHETFLQPSALFLSRRMRSGARTGTETCSHPKPYLQDEQVAERSDHHDSLQSKYSPNQLYPSKVLPSFLVFVPGLHYA